VARTVFVDRGVIVASRPAHVDSVVDLAGKFIVPPYGEAHNHNIEGSPAETIAKYLAAGIYYVKDPCSFPEAAVEAVGKINIPTSIDGVFSGGCLTSPDGHPSGLVRRNIARGNMKAIDGDGRFFHALTDSMDFERRWPAILAAKTDFIKVILVYSEEHAKRRNDPVFFNWHGMDPALLPLVVLRAHSAGLRVSAHIESAADFHAAVSAGVDEINHMPGFRPDRDSIPLYRGPLTRYMITAADARQASKQGTVVVTTLGEMVNLIAGKDVVVRTTLGKTVDLAAGANASGLDAASIANVRRLYVRNLRLLRAAGVRIVLGSDNYRSNTVSEIMAIRTLGVFSDAELLRMWSITTPQAIFPGRHLACFDAGCEASFLALAGNPLSDFENVQRISMRMKRGVLLP
jgi:imidazolonepropionase-like amidohydrolase